MNNYYVIPALGLAVQVKKFNDKKIQSAYVVNGNWNLVRGDKFWYALNVSDSDPEKGYVNKWEIDLWSDNYVKIPENKQKYYGEAIAYGIAVLNMWKKLIPSGPYCYDSKTCPFWGKDSSRPQQESGFCTLLNRNDWDEGAGIPLLSDRVKECGINNERDWDVD